MRRGNASLGAALAALVLATGLLPGCGGSALPEASPAGQPAAPVASADKPTLSELRTELARQVADIQNVPPAAPGGEDTRTLPVLSLVYPADSSALPGVKLSWDQALPGDLDQNGEVDADDLAVLLQFWGDSVPYTSGSNAHPTNPWLAFLDADGNRVIGTGDIKAIAAHYRQQLDGYRVYRRTIGAPLWERLPDPSGAAADMTVALASGVQQGYAVRAFSFTDAAPPAAELEYAVLPYFAAGQAEGTASDPLPVRPYPRSVSLPEINGFDAVGFINQPIKCEVDCVLQLAAAGGTVSTDLDADGTYEQQDPVPGDGQQFAALRSYTFHTPGRHLLRSRLVNGMGTVVFAQRQIEVMLGNRPPVIQAHLVLPETTAPVAIEVSTAGTYDPDGNSLTITTSLQGPGDAAPVQIAQAFGVGSAADQSLFQPGAYVASVTAVDSFGATAHWSQAFSLTAGTGSSAWDYTVLDENLSSDFISDHKYAAAVISGVPALAVEENQRIEYRQAADANGLHWPIAGAGEQLAGAGQYLLQLTEVNGRAAALLKRAGDGMDGYAVRGAAGGWSTPSILPGGPQAEGTLAVLAGRPAFCFTTADRQLCFVRALDQYGLQWPAGAVVPERHVAYSPMLLEVAGQPTIAYQDHDLVLHLLGATDPAMLNWTPAANYDEHLTATLLTPGSTATPLFLEYNRAEALPALPPLQVFVRSGVGTYGRTLSPPQAVPTPPVANLVTNPPGILALTGGLVQGRPCVAYADPSTLNLMLLEATDAYGTGWKPAETVDSRGESGYPLGILILLDVHGQPALVYDAVTADPAAGVLAPSELRYARRRG